MKLFGRIALLLGAVAYLGLLGISIAGQWVLDHPTRQNLERGIGWDPDNHSIWARYARQWHFRANSPDSSRAVEGYRRAAALNPLDPSNWRDLATVQMERGDLEGAEIALRGELAAIPHSPQASWRMANLLLVKGRSEEAYPYLITAATNDVTLRHPVFDLAWRLEEDPGVIWEKLVPATPEARGAYLHFLLVRRRLSEAYPVWQAIASPSPESLRLGNSYVEALANSGMGSYAGRVWGELLSLTGRNALRSEGEFLTDPDFEGEIQNAGLGWRMIRGEGYQIALDSFVFRHGTQSLRVSFDGTVNLNFAGVYQIIPVEPNRRYRLEGFLRTDSITTDSGVFFQVATVGAPREESFFLYSSKHAETASWVREEIEFQTGPRTSVVAVHLRRSPSQKLNNLIQGKVWIDNLSLRLRQS
jgi:hypothetical protein